MKAEQLSGMFSLREFDELHAVILYKLNAMGGSYTRYFAGKVLPKNEAMRKFSRHIGES